MSNNCTPKAQERMDWMHGVELSDTVKRTLRILKLLNFS